MSQEVRYVLYKSKGSMVTPLVRLVPVRGLETEALELMSRIIDIRVREG